MRFLSIPKTKAAIIVTAITLVVAAAVIVVIVYSGGSPPDVTVGNGELRISGMYGRTVSLADVENVTLHERSMSEIGVGRRTNGYGGIETLKGHFNSDALGAHLLFVRKSASPTLHIDIRDGADIYISFDDGEITRALYDDLRAATGR